MCILWPIIIYKSPHDKYMSQVGNHVKQYFPPLYRWVVRSVPAISQHGDDPKNDMRWCLTVTLCTTIFSPGRQAVGNTEEIAPSSCHQIKKNIYIYIATLATDLSYCQYEHIRKLVADKHPVTPIKKCLHICTFSFKKINVPLFRSPQRPCIQYIPEHCRLTYLQSLWVSHIMPNQMVPERMTWMYTKPLLHQFSEMTAQ